MRWQGRQGSGNIEDRRGSGRGGLAVGGGIGGVLLLVLGLLFGGDPSEYINGGTQTGVQTGAGNDANDAAEDPRAKFVAVVLQDTEDVWNKLFAEQLNQDYREPKLVLFSNSVQSGCGGASAASGPFYCPADQKVYIDLVFYDQLQNRFQAPGDFAMAYVVAHEVGHHIQQLLGITNQVRKSQQGMSKAEANELSVRLELQADFLAGVWARHADAINNILEEGDIEEALNAANAIGDDRLQMQSQGFVVPESFTHGTSKQRKYWFMKGYKTGDLNQGDTFNNPQ
jgi:predicted metalloprotease